ncbi:hypothetical protein [Protaetiibacter mangrovi]|uniref:SRPBCC family protein n=1 Tax=Protaetiibacter mangrovi TaxID=2970926 RepID=A0ABT1ZD32_9MICO|nr:hypothetical protein [Protaetiibacter mangrovi]MCS0498613.1 hypothetical protein [Protaetiibacter mangrovi]
MRVQLSFRVGCDADRAWAIVTSPDAAASAYAPLLVMTPETELPQRWSDGDDAVVRLRGAGVLPLGRQRILVRTRRLDGTRILEDAGGPISGPLAIVTSWRHRMAVTPLASGGTRYRDRLDVSAGIATPLVWFGLWLVWQARGLRIRRMMARG